ARTLWRLGLTRKHLLEWQTSSQSEREVAVDAGATWRAMWPAVLVAAVILALAALGELAHPDHARRWLVGAVVLPLVALLRLAPAIASQLSKHAPPHRPQLSHTDRRLA